MLDALAKKYGTDKSTDFHGYTNHYEKYFKYHNGNSLLEIGIFNGASLKMWSEYFPTWEITGVDINQECKQYEEGNIKVIIEDQKKLVLDTNYDIIIDDGSHNPEDFLTTLYHLWNKLKRGGFYCIEDLSVCNHPNYPKLWEKVLREFHNDIYNHMTTINKMLPYLGEIHIFNKLIMLEKSL